MLIVLCAGMATLLVAAGCAGGAAQVGPGHERAAPAEGSPEGASETSSSSTADSSDPRGALIRAEVGAMLGDMEPLGNDPVTLEAFTAHAKRLWQARRTGDWAVAWEYRDMLRAMSVTRDAFVTWSEANEPFVYSRAEVVDAVVEDARGWVLVDLEVNMRNIPGAPARSVMRWERWLHEHGRWAPIAPSDSELHPAAPAERATAYEPALRERFERWWDAVYARDWETLYELSDPVDRRQVSLEQFISGREQLIFVDHEVEWMQAIGTFGTVRCRYLIRMNDPSLEKMPPRLTVVNERWRLRDGVWYHRLLAGES
jgi:hypothetical protein